MQLETVDEKIEWNARRIAAAFGAQEWREVKRDEELGFLGLAVFWEGKSGDVRFKATFIAKYATLYRMWIGGLKEEDDDYSTGLRMENIDGMPSPLHKWVLWGEAPYHDIMARGLYRIGFEDEYLLSLLPELSAHEKLELRQNFPREFWPRKWLDGNEKDLVERRRGNRYTPKMRELDGEFAGARVGREPISVTEAEFQEVEAFLGAKLPDDYREFVRDYGGYRIYATFPLQRWRSSYEFGAIIRNREYTFNDRNIIAKYRDLRAKGLPEEWLPIVSGNKSEFYAMEFKGQNKGAIYHVTDDSFQRISKIADSFDELMQSLSLWEDEFAI